jgi:hypothetical protein
MPESPVTGFAYPNAFPRPLAGRVEQHTITSELLAKTRSVIRPSGRSRSTSRVPQLPQTLPHGVS